MERNCIEVSLVLKAGPTTIGSRDPRTGLRVTEIGRRRRQSMGSTGEDGEEPGSPK